MSNHHLNLDTTSSNSDTIVSSRSIPVEIADTICTNATRHDLLSVLRANKQYHAIAARLLYRQVSVHGINARRFFLAILSPTGRRRTYTQYVTTLTYYGNSKEDEVLTSSIFVDALLFLDRLQHLHIVMDEKYSSMLLAGLYKKEIIREYKTIFDELRDNVKNAGCLLTLPCLRSLTIDGDHRLASIARCRRLDSVFIVEPLDLDALSNIINNIRYPNKETVAHVRSIGFHFKTLSTRVFALIFRGLAEVFPNATHVCMYMPSANPLAIGDIMTQGYSCFSKLKTLAINKPGPYFDPITPDLFLLPEDECHAFLTSQIERAGHWRPSMCRVTYGLRTWLRENFNTPWVMTLEDNNTNPLPSQTNAPQSGRLVYCIPRHFRRRKHTPQ